MRQALRRVGEHSSPTGREGVACCAPTKTVNVAGDDPNEGSRDKRPPKKLLTDERLDTAPEAVRDARRRLRGLIPEASRLHLELVVAARNPNAENNKEKARQLKARRARLVSKLCEVLDERDSLWAVIEDYLTKADG